MGDDDDRRDGRARNRDPGRARRATADTRAVLMAAVVRGRWRLVALGGDGGRAMRMVLSSGGLRGHGSLMRRAQPERAGFPDRKGDPETDQGRNEPEPAGVTHYVHNVRDCRAVPVSGRCPFFRSDGVF